MPERAHAIGAEVVQVFNSNPRVWRPRAYGSEEIAALASGLSRYHLPLFVHTIYLINLASPDLGLRRRSAEALAHALAMGARARATGVVTHVGSHRGDGFPSSLPRIVAALGDAARAATRMIDAEGGDPALPPLLLETSAGSGGIVGSTLEEIERLLADTSAAGPDGPPGRLSLGLCLDTAHLFAAGYPLHTASGLKALVGELRERGLLGSVGLIHLNDSKTPFGSNRDRHENLGEGEIGRAPLGRVVREPAFARIPFVLEVPGEDGSGPDLPNVNLAKLMREGAAGRPTRPAPPA